MSQVTDQKLIKGGEFLLTPTSPANVFTPEQWNEEQKSIAGMCKDFLEQKIWPDLDNIDYYQPENIMVTKMKEAGEQGLLGISVPEEYGGYGLDFNTGMLAAEVMGQGHSFSVALTAHTGIGTLPILYFGNEAQKAKYLPKLATGEWMASYCLTEPGSGSDALGAKTKAVLNAEGTHYIINGQKMWITNAGFADVFVVFAKIDGDKFTGFILERTMPGISFNPEEKKMGIKGSSTRQVFFSDVKVPVENVLGEIGRGHVIAFNILNIGRIKLASATLGGAKAVVHHAVRYANERQQFNTPIASFGAIQHKLAEQAIRVWVLESATYRGSGDIQEAEHKSLAEGKGLGAALLGAADEFQIECAIMKVLGSETLDYVVDEGVQVLGGYGFSADFPMDRAYRDSRINRIFEGTNEINRMLSVGQLMKKAMKGELDFMSAAMAVQKELMSGGPAETAVTGFLAQELAAVENFKKAALMTIGAAAQKYMAALKDEQEVLLNAADMLIQIYAAESAILRTQKLAAAQGEAAAALYADICRTYVTDAADRIYLAGKNVVFAIAEGDMQKGLITGLRKYTKVDAFNTVAARRRIAAKLIADNAYSL